MSTPGDVRAKIRSRLREVVGKHPGLVGVSDKIGIRVNQGAVKAGALESKIPLVKQARSVSSGIRRRLADQISYRSFLNNVVQNRPLIRRVVYGNLVSITTYPLPKPPVPASVLYTAAFNGHLGVEVAAVAGLQARNQPKIYLTGDQSISRIQNAMKQYYGASFDGSKTPEQLIQQYALSKEVVLFSGAGAIDELNVALVLAGVFDIVPVPTADITTMHNLGFNTGTPMFDIRGKWGTGVTGSFAAKQWLWQQVQGKVSQEFLICNPQGRVALSDYIVWSKSMELSIGFKATLDQSMKNFVSSVLNTYPQPRVSMGYLGWGSEVPFVTAISGGSRFGSSASNSLFGANPVFNGGWLYNPCAECADLSLTQGYPPFRGAVKGPPSIPVYQKGHKYVGITTSQSDALWWDQSINAAYKEAAEAAKMPVSIPVSNVLSFTNPPLMQWYYDTAAPTTCIVAGTDGAAYTHPEQMPNEDYFCLLAAQLCNAVGAQDLFCIFAGAYGGTTLPDFITKIKGGGWTPHSILLWESGGHAPQVVGGVPVLTTALPFVSGPDVLNSGMTSAQIAAIIAKGAANTDFVYVILNTSYPAPATLVQAVASLGSNFSMVRMDQMVELYKQSVNLKTSRLTGSLGIG